MERKWLEINKLNPQSHPRTGEVLRAFNQGLKVHPILVRGEEILDGDYICNAFLEIGKNYVEAWVATPEERGKTFKVHGKEIVVEKDGLRNLPLMEGNEGQKTKNA